MKKVKAYEAFDGILFMTRRECKDYEGRELNNRLCNHIRANCNSSFNMDSLDINKIDRPFYKLEDVVSYIVDYHEFIKEVVEAKKDSNQSIFDGAPDWVNWSATDFNGEIYWYEVEPEPCGGRFDMIWDTKNECEWVTQLDGPVVDWTDSLVKRIR